MVVFVILTCLLAGALIVALLLFATRWSLELTFTRVSWIPPAALVLEILLWRPILQHLGEIAALPALLTCIGSLFLAVVGATLVAAARQRNEPDHGLLRATLVAFTPGMLLLAYMAYGLLGYPPLFGAG